MTPDQYTTYLTRLREIRSTLTDPKRIKFIDDILSALSYKDAVIQSIQMDRSKLIESNTKLRIEADRYRSQRNICASIVGKLYVKDC